MIISLIVMTIYMAVWLLMSHLKMVDDLVEEIQIVPNRWFRVILGVFSVIASPSIFLFLIMLSGAVIIIDFFRDIWEDRKKEGQ